MPFFKSDFDSGLSVFSIDPSKWAPVSIAIVLWIISPSTWAEEVRVTFFDLIVPATKPLIISSFVLISPLIFAFWPTVKRLAFIFPSTSPSIWISPEVVKFPFINKSVDKKEGGELSVSFKILLSIL